MRNRRGNQRDTLVFIMISVCLMLLADQVIFGGKRGYIEKIRADYHKEHPENTPASPGPDTAPPEPAPTPAPEDHSDIPLEPDYRDLPAPEPLFPIHDETFSPSAPLGEAAEGPTPSLAPAQPQVGPVDTPKTLQVASLPPITPPPRGIKGKIAIIIDDVGMNIKNSREVVALPGPVTLAFLPYASHTPELAQHAIIAGHEAMIHTPMEAIGDNNGLGPMALRSTMDAPTLRAELDKMFASFTGYRGINNHMGSKLTQDSAAMDAVMQALKQKGLYFVDSKTIAGSVAADRARAAGIPFAARDVFLDHEETPAYVASALAKTVHLALQNGSAIAIGHPKDVTINGLRQWLPTLKDKGVELVPVSALLIQPAAVVQIPVISPAHDSAPPVLTPAITAPATAPPSAAAPAVPVQPPAPLPAVQP